MVAWRKRRSSPLVAQPTRDAQPTQSGPIRSRPLHADPHPPKVIDLTDGAHWSNRLQSDPRLAVEMAERARRRAAQTEAKAELHRLRSRHWSGERLIEEGRRAQEWWQHPEADPHAVLGLIPGASLEQAASERRRIAKECHPDRAYESRRDRELAQQRMIAANSAYDRLRRALMYVG